MTSEDVFPGVRPRVPILKVALCLFILALLVSPFEVALADSMPAELATENETYFVSEPMMCQGNSYQIVTYRNGDTILLDSYGNLVTNVDTLNNAYLIAGYTQTFSNYGITETRYAAMSKAITDYCDSLEVLTNPSSVVVLGLLGAALPTIIIPVVGIVSGPTLVASLIFLAGRLRDAAELPQSTIDQILVDFTQVRNGKATPETYENILRLSDQLRTQMTDWGSQFIVLGYNVWGSLGEILYKIGDAGSTLWGIGDIAKQIKNAGSGMIESQRTLSSSLNWLSSWTAEQVKTEAASSAQRMMDSQNRRIDTLRSEFEKSVNSLRDLYAQAQAREGSAASQGADTSYAEILLEHVLFKLEQADGQAIAYRYRTAGSTLREAHDLLLSAESAIAISIDIHQAEARIAEAQDDVSQKTAKGANVSQANRKLEDAEISLTNAKALLVSGDFESARIQVSNAIQSAQEAKNLADAAVTPPQSTFVPRSFPSSQSPAIPIGLIVLSAFAIIALLSVTFISRHFRWKKRPGSIAS